MYRRPANLVRDKEACHYNMCIDRAAAGLDTSAVVAIVFGIVSVTLAIAGLYVAFKQLQLAAFHA